MSRASQPASRSILLSRPTNEFTGLYTAIRQRNFLLAGTAILTMLARVLPILMSNIVYTLQQTYLSYLICARASMGILSLMIIVLFASMLIRWPDLPLDPQTVMGSMYYVIELTKTGGFNGMGKATARQREKVVTELDGKYRYGKLNSGGSPSGGRMQIYSEKPFSRQGASRGSCP